MERGAMAQETKGQGQGKEGCRRTEARKIPDGPTRNSANYNVPTFTAYIGSCTARNQGRWEGKDRGRHKMKGLGMVNPKKNKSKAANFENTIQIRS